jgi:FtsH-binding integral membrane protein
MTSAPVIAASIFLDGLNVFLFFLRIFGGRDLFALPAACAPRG